MYYLGIDPGKYGGFAVVDNLGNLIRCDAMPLVGDKISAQAISDLLREYYHEFNSEGVNVAIEEIYTLPSDALPQKGLEAFRRLFVASGQYLSALTATGKPDRALLMELQDSWSGCTPFADAKVRVDGRKGLLSYAKGAGMLHMCALFRWAIKEVKPSIWCREMKQGLDRSKSTKDQSYLAAQALWPAAMSKGGGEFWKSTRAKKPHEGCVEAALIAEWVRRKICGKSAS